MIKVICKDNKIVYNAYNLIKAFIPEREVMSELNEEQAERIYVKGEEFDVGADDIRELYIKMNENIGKELPWGMLTGVRPAKLASKWIEEELEKYPSAEKAKEAFVSWFYEDRRVSKAKAETAFNVAMKEKTLMPDEIRGGYSVYVGIPFCPSVCSYCSFSSGAISAYKDKVDAYLKALCREITVTAKLLQDHYSAFTGCCEEKCYPTTIYMGGGTPTSLSHEQLDQLLSHMNQAFDIKNGLKSGKIKEFTVEAGRPDSITREKLEVLKSHAVTRISINPQSMQQKTLDIIGRRHTVEQIKETYKLARELGFDNINMDMIVGLTGEDNYDVKDTLRQISEMSPDSLTVHSLALKRASALGIAKRTGKSTEENENMVKADINQMIVDAMAAANQMGMSPYYLYRQKSIAGNFENVGYAKPGKEGLYNVLIMEEVQHIVACGSGTVTKRIFPGGRLERCDNIKDVTLYINKIEEIIERKKKFWESPIE